MVLFRVGRMSALGVFLALCCASASSHAQTASPFDAGVTAGLVAETTDPQQLVDDCLQNCLATDTRARAQVCGTVPNTSICLNRRDVPSCVLAHRALEGVLVQVSPSLCPSSTAQTRTASAVVAPPSPQELARQRSRRERAARACANQGAFVDACIECSMSSGRTTWLSSDTEQERAMVAIGVGAQPSHAAEARFRCMDLRVLPLHNILAATRAVVTRDSARLTTIEGRPSSIASSGLPTDTAQVMVQLLDGLMYEQLSRERERAATDLHLCERSAALPENQALPLVPADMMFWPVDLIRRRGYRPRTEQGETCAQERQRLTLAQEQVERIEHDPARATTNDLLRLSGHLRRIAEGCGAEPTSPTCVAAQADLRRYVSAPSGDSVTPAAAPPTLPSSGSDLHAGNP